MTGLSGAGKTTLANQAKMALARQNIPVSVLDGDVLRQGLNAGLGFSEQDRNENIRRTAEAAKLLADAGVITLVSLISPFTQARENARAIIGSGNFAEVFVNCPLNEAKTRDPKGLYAKAEAGEIKLFTGIDSVYEPPVKPDLELRTDLHSVEKCTEQLLHFITARIAPAH